MVLLTQTIQEESIHIVSNTKREDSDIAGICVGSITDDRESVSLSYCWLAVGKGDDIVRMIVFLEQGEHRDKGNIDVRSSVSIELLPSVSI